MSEIKRVFLSLIFGMMLLCSLSLASAFIVSTNDTNVNVCTSSTTIINDAVYSDTGGTFSVSISGTAAVFTTTIPYSFSLNAGESGIIYSYITPSSKLSPGNYELIVKVEYNGNVKESKHTIIVGDCRGATINIDATKKVCPCQPTTMLLELKNNGLYTEDYILSIQGILKDYVTLSQDHVVLSSNQSSVISVNINTSCNLLGDYDLTFLASSNGVTRATAKTNYSILPCYEYSILTEKDIYTIDEHSNLVIPLTISNEGTINNNYKIIISGPEWAALDKKEISIVSGEKAIANLLLNPPYGVSGNFTVKLESMSDQGNVKKTKEIKIDIEKGYSILLDIIKSKDLICNAVSTSYEVKIKNTGKFGNSVDLNVEGPEWAKLSSSSASLAPNEEKILNLTLTPAYPSTTQDFTIAINAVDAISKTSAKDSIIITSATKEACFTPSITSEKDSVNVKQDSTATILLTIENKGQEKADYILELAGTASGFVKLNPSTISVEPNKAKTLYLYIAPPITTAADNYSIVLSAKMNETAVLGSKEIKINVVSSEKELPLENITNVTAQENPFVSFWKDVDKMFKGFILKIISFFAMPEKNVSVNITNVSISKENLTVVNIANLTEEIPAENETITINKTEEKINVINVTNITLENETAEINASNITEIKENITINATNETENVTANKTSLIDMIKNWIKIKAAPTAVTNVTNITNITNITITNVTEIENVTNVTNITLPEEISKTNETNVSENAPQIIKALTKITVPKNESVSIDLKDYFKSPKNETLEYMVFKQQNLTLSFNGSQLNIGTNENSSEKYVITVYATNGKDITPMNVTLYVQEASSAVPISQAMNDVLKSTKDFCIQYAYYLIGAIVLVIIIIIFASGFYKKIIDFFEEDVDEKPKNGKKK